ncbi:MAG: hypothetical protein CO140_01535 [Candidatus Moranbacteria bacterium CG_4_9_14_3_um_filter_40_7]|nr:MAG: hypothetical protein CO140_01535 [Candidatus Moranbacteria bacterium CG_4_9_14_3_um_filter_40_7]
MFKEIKKYLADNMKSFYRKLFILALFLFIIGVFYGNFILVKKLVANLISEEKNTHAQEVCTTLDDINQKTNFFLGQLEQMQNRRNYLSNEQKRGIIQSLRKLEGDVRKIEMAYLGFYFNDLSIKFFSGEKETPVDILFSQIKNLPIYGYRAVEAMENSLAADYITRDQKDVLQSEFAELQGKIESIDNASKICNISFKK